MSRSRTISEAGLVAVAMFSGDWHPIHTGVEYAAADSRFGRRIAHGVLVLPVAALGLAELRPAVMRAFYGIDGLRFVAPTRIGDTRRVETEVVAVDPRGPEDGVASPRCVVRDQEGSEVVVGRLKCLVVSEAA